MNMTKIELCSRISKKFNRAAVELKPLFEAFLDEILNTLAEGHRIEIRGFGCFKVKKREKRIGRNPRTGETVDIPTHLSPVFKFSKDAQKSFENKLKKKEGHKHIDPVVKAAKPVKKATESIPEHKDTSAPAPVPVPEFIKDPKLTIFNA
jgi:integration host factor subunit beta